MRRCKDGDLGMGFEGTIAVCVCAMVTTGGIITGGANASSICEVALQFLEGSVISDNIMR